jgi:hypothetical protein
MDKKPHPAKFSNELLPALAKHCYGDIIDIMAGTGKAGLLKRYNTKIKSVTINELEEEWAMQAKDNMVDTIIIGDARNLSGWYDCIVTSPPYGNRMADNFKPSKPDSMRRRYAGDLGRNPSAGSVCCSHFGRGYEFQMLEILSCVLKNIQHSRIVWNTSNFIRNFVEVDVFSFYNKLFISSGYSMVAHEKIETKRQKGVGANTHLRVKYEDIAVYDKKGI